jgi:NADH-quinone oxidoreductase subunit J
MTLLTFLFYGIAILTLASTAMAVTRRNMIHAALYLVLSFFCTALLFYLLGAPYLAAMEIIIYAGAIMVLFLFIIMMIRIDKAAAQVFRSGQLVPAIIISMLWLVALTLLVLEQPNAAGPLVAAQASPGEFGFYVFRTHWLSIEIASMLLLVALIAALLLGLGSRGDSPRTPSWRQGRH